MNQTTEVRGRFSEAMRCIARGHHPEVEDLSPADRANFARETVGRLVRECDGRIGNANFVDHLARAQGVSIMELGEAHRALGVIEGGRAASRTYVLEASATPTNSATLPVARSSEAPSVPSARAPAAPPYSASELLARAQRIAAAPEAKLFPEMAAQLVVQAGISTEGALDALRLAAGRSAIYTPRIAGRSSTTSERPRPLTNAEIFAKRAAEVETARADRYGTGQQATTHSSSAGTTAARPTPESSNETFERRKREAQAHRNRLGAA